MILSIQKFALPLLTVRRWYAIPGAQAKKEEMSMAYLDRESMSEDIRERYEALSEYEKGAVEALMEAEDYSIEEIEEALDIVENGDLAYYIDYDWPGSDLSHDGYTETSRE